MIGKEKLVELIYDDVGGVTKAVAEAIADHILADGWIRPLCKVGDKVYALLEDDFPVHKWYLSEEVVSDVSVRGIWLSGVVPAQDDHGIFCEWSEVGVEIFLSRDQAAKALAEKGGAQE